MALILSILVGAGLGGLMGYYVKCASGTCLLTATPGRGVIYGMVLELLFYSALGHNGAGSAEQSTANVKPVNAAEFDFAIEKINGPVVVDSFATWCRPCKRLYPVLDKLAGPFTNQIQFLKVHVDKSGTA